MARERKEQEEGEEYLCRFLTDNRLRRLDEILSLRTSSLTIVLDRVHNYHNISAVMRSAEAFGLAEIHLLGSTFEYSRDISLGTEQWIDLHVHQSAAEALSALKERGYGLVILEPYEKALLRQGIQAFPIYQLPFEEKLALVFGNEHEGVSEEICTAARYSAYIPMFGFVDSLNISVACAVSLFCSTIAPSEGRRRVQALSDPEKELLRRRWLRSRVRRADAILREIERRKR